MNLAVADDIPVRRGMLAAVRVRLLILLAIAICIYACNQPFDPRAPLEPQLVVYSVLSTDRSAQFVRVNSNYMPSGFDPNVYTADSWVSDASVKVIGGTNTWILRDTSVARPDTSRYKFPFRMYTLNPFVPEHGRSYNVLVQSPSIGVAQATVTVPAKPSIVLDPNASTALNAPLSALPEYAIQYTIDLSNTAGGYTSHMYIYYDVLKGSQWVEERFEVPLEPIPRDTTYSLDNPIYDQLNPNSLTNRVTIQFRAGYLATIIKKLSKVQYVDTHLIFKWIVLTVLQADRNLFGYYKSLRVYQDPISIRLDQPLYSKIDGGIGLVGAYALDSTMFVLPGAFGGNR